MGGERAGREVGRAEGGGRTAGGGVVILRGGAFSFSLSLNFLCYHFSIFLGALITLPVALGG